MSANLYEAEAKTRNYARTAILIMLKAFDDVLGSDNINSLTVEFTIGPHIFINPDLKVELTKNVYSTVWTKMHDYIEADLPITKETFRVSDIYNKCIEGESYDEAAFLHFRRASRITVSSFEDYRVYFYGSVYKHSGQIKAFDLMPYKHGFFLMLPDICKDPETIAPFDVPEKFFDCFSESYKNAHLLGVDDMTDINKIICSGESTDLILTCESIFDNQLALTAQNIITYNKKFVFIAGPSSSGKTSTANRLAYALRSYGIKPRILSLDNYYIDRSQLQDDIDIEAVEALDVDLFTKNMNDLIKGKEVELPNFNFVTQKREYSGEKITLGDKDIIIIEGIHGLNDCFTEGIAEKYIFKVYVSALFQLNIDSHNRIHSSDIRLLRRIVRDYRARGSNAAEVISMWPSVRAGEEKNIFPYQGNADAVINSAMVYELAAIKPYAERLLFCVKRDTPEYTKAKELLKFLDFAIPLQTDEIPPASIIREFIGGSCLNVG